MEKDNNFYDKETHTISINERQNINLTGVTKIESFDNEEFLMKTIMGTIGIKGKNLEIVKLDTYQGTISIKGIINSLVYLEDIKNKQENNLVTRLFK